MNETIDLLALANSVWWHGHLLRSEDGHLLRSEDGHLLRSEDGHLLRSEDGHLLRSEDGHVLRMVLDLVVEGQRKIGRWKRAYEKQVERKMYKSWFEHGRRILPIKVDCWHK